MLSTKKNKIQTFFVVKHAVFFLFFFFSLTHTTYIRIEIGNRQKKNKKILKQGLHGEQYWTWIRQWKNKKKISAWIDWRNIDWCLFSLSPILHHQPLFHYSLVKNRTKIQYILIIITKIKRDLHIHNKKVSVHFVYIYK